MKLDRRNITKIMEDQGAVLRHSGKHLTFAVPGGALVVLSTTPGKGRATRNMESTLRRHGLSLNPSKRGGKRG